MAKGISETQKRLRLELARYVTAAAIYRGLKDKEPFSHLQVLGFLADGGFATGVLLPLSELISSDADEAFRDKTTYIMGEHLQQFANYDILAEINKVKEAEKALKEFTGNPAEAVAMAMEMDAMISGLYAPCLYRAIYDNVMSRPDASLGLNFDGTTPAYDLALIEPQDIQLISDILVDGPLPRKAIEASLATYDGLKHYTVTIDLLLTHS